MEFDRLIEIVSCRRVKPLPLYLRPAVSFPFLDNDEPASYTLEDIITIEFSQREIPHFAMRR